LLVVLVVAAGCSSSAKKAAPPPSPTATTSTTAAPPAPTPHVFVINLENKGFDQVWGESSDARWLNDTLVPKGKLLTNYYATSHASLGNYITEISGQPSNSATNADCVVYTEYVNGKGCVYPASVKNIGDQLTTAAKTWKSYQEDMRTPCRHPQIGSGDNTVVARKGDQYATRHNPFMYFHSIIDSPDCAKDVVDLGNLTTDLASATTTPNLSFITPNLCHDGHDSPCVDGQPGGMTSVDQWLQQWVPKILASPAFKQDGLLIITLDESEGTNANAACCGQKAPGGGRVGALLISPKITPASIDDTPYNHYSLLCGMEDVLGLPHLAPHAKCFAPAVYSS
jgi:phospholipase C